MRKGLAELPFVMLNKLPTLLEVQGMGLWEVAKAGSSWTTQVSLAVLQEMRAI